MDEYARPLQAADGTSWLYFAGEATCKVRQACRVCHGVPTAAGMLRDLHACMQDHYATVHGAFLSGRRSAKEADASFQGVGINFTSRISLSIHTLEERAQLVAKAAIQLRRLKAKAQETLASETETAVEALASEAETVVEALDSEAETAVEALASEDTADGPGEAMAKTVPETGGLDPTPLASENEESDQQEEEEDALQG